MIELLPSLSTNKDIQYSGVPSESGDDDDDRFQEEDNDICEGATTVQGSGRIGIKTILVSICVLILVLLLLVVVGTELVVPKQQQQQEVVNITDTNSTAIDSSSSSFSRDSTTTTNSTTSSISTNIQLDSFFTRNEANTIAIMSDARGSYLAVDDHNWVGTLSYTTYSTQWKLLRDNTRNGSGTADEKYYYIFNPFLKKLLGGKSDGNVYSIPTSESRPFEEQDHTNDGDPRYHWKIEWLPSCQHTNDWEILAMKQKGNFVACVRFANKAVNKTALATDVGPLDETDWKRNQPAVLHTMAESLSDSAQAANQIWILCTSVRCS